MENEKKMSEHLWVKPEVTVINLKEYEDAIVANARSGSGCGCGCGCNWSVGCKILL